MSKGRGKREKKARNQEIKHEANYLLCFCALCLYTAISAVNIYSMYQNICENLFRKFCCF